MELLDRQRSILGALEAREEDQGDMMTIDMMTDGDMTGDMRIGGTDMMTADETDMMTVGDMNLIHEEEDIMNQIDHPTGIVGTSLKNAGLKLHNGMQRHIDNNELYTNHCTYDHHAYMAAKIEVSSAKRARPLLNAFSFLDPAKSLNRSVPASCVKA